MAFHNILFPLEISFGAAGGPAYNVSIARSKGGVEHRNLNRAEADYGWDVAFGVRNQESLDILLAFWHGRKGKFNSFRYKDNSNFTVGLADNGVTITTPQNIGTGDDFQAAYQMFRRHSDGFTVTDIDILLPVVGTLTVSVNSVVQTEGSGDDYTVDYLTGIITFNGGSIPASGHAVEISTQYHWKVRFDIDRMFTNIDFLNLYSWGSIMLRAVPQNET